jgi:hypothetical protein
MSETSTDAARRRQALREAATRRHGDGLRPLAKPRLESITLPTPRAAVRAEAGARPDVFISYSHADRGIVEELAADLAARELAPWWDGEILGGQHFRRTILEALAAARSVVVVWSPSSVESRYVLDEAERALRAEKLVTAHVDGFDTDLIPLGFGGLQSIPVADRSRLHSSLAPLLR